MDLVVGTSNDALKTLVSKLGSLLAQEYTLIRGVRDDIQYITDELASMQAFLKRAPQGDDPDAQRLDWMKQVREVSYDIEDCVDDVEHRLLRGQPRGSGILPCLWKKWYVLTTLHARRCIATDIANLKARAHHVSERRMRYGVENLNLQAKDGGSVRANAPSRLEPRVPPPQLIGTRAPVGIEDDMKKLEPWFDDDGTQQGTDEPRVRFLAIYGVGGVGKTTLAMELYRELGHKFDQRAYVLASQKFHLPTVLRGLIRQLHEQQSRASNNNLDGIEEWEEKYLKSVLASQLNERYLILIDDIWSVSTWENIRDCFPNNNAKGGRIVVTTRFKSVAEACRRHDGHFHEQKPLSKENSCKLFQQAFSSFGNEWCPSKPIEGDITMKVCGGLPLAIIVVAGLVASQLKSDKDLEVDPSLNKVEEDLRQELASSITTEGVTQILINHCYKHLQSDLKTCLLYLSMFPKGCLISRKRLIRRWIAEGFIAEKQGNTVEEVAEDCFNQLMRMNLVRAVNNSSNGKVKTCQIHDMVLEYIVDRSSDENFITVVGGHWQTPFPTYKVRRLCVQKNDGKEKEKVEKMKLSHVRSLTALGSFRALHSTLHKFQMLQVLDLEGCKDLSSKQLKKICKIHQLKYLSLRQTDVAEIPSKIGRLESLEVLDIRETSITELPDSVDKLQRMEHLLAGNKKVWHALKLTKGIPKMTSLQTLSGVEICTGSAAELLIALQSLTNLKKFTIYKVGRLSSGNEELLLSAIEHLSSCSLKHFAIDDDFTGFIENRLNASQAPPEHLHTLRLFGKLSRLPGWICLLHNLKKLTLPLTSLTTASLKVLAKLPELFSLIFSLDPTNNGAGALKILRGNTVQSGGKIFVLSEGFEKLKLLRLVGPVLPSLSFLKGAMPELQRMELRFRMVEGVYGLENLASIRQVVLSVSSQASEDAMAKAYQVKQLASMIGGAVKAPSVVLHVYNESSEHK